jgi:1-phosphofructokinase
MVGETHPRVTVLAAAPTVSVEIVDESGENAEQSDENRTAIHLHAGGQGAWVASMAAALGADVIMCSPLGGEFGEPLRHLLTADGITVRDTGLEAGTGAAIVEVRSDDRKTVSSMPSPALGRHELDDLYGLTLVEALDSDVLVVTGVDPPSLVPADFFGRLVADVRAAGVPVVADLSGEAALAAIEEAPTVLKMSHEEVLAGELASDDSVDALRAAAAKLVAQGIEAVVISRAAEPALLVTAEGARLITTPDLKTVVHQGAGDSMTAGIAVGLARGIGVVEAVRLGASAGALNVARHGLGSGKREHIERFADQIEVGGLLGEEG